MHVI
jgi:hypothetical protein